jgi:hypothetical protein
VLVDAQKRTQAQQAAQRVIDRKSSQFRATHPAYRKQ